MDFGFEDRKPLLYADLFKPCSGEREYMGVMAQCGEGWSSSSNHESSSFDSSSSSSELGSEDGDFIAELSRQMAECMLEDEEEEMNSSVQLKINNEPGVGKRLGPGRVMKEAAELTRQMPFQRREQNYGGLRGRRKQVGPGMRAVFLGGPGSRNGSSGTGVFLPRVANDPVEPKKKSGLSTVLIPTRVLEALELHFNRFSDSAAPPFMTSGSPPHQPSPEEEEWSRSKREVINRDTKFKIHEASRDIIDEMQRLPKEWTY